jgi:DNA-binding response OmpR family regulator
MLFSGLHMPHPTVLRSVREEILDMVWGRNYFGELKIVDVNIRRLRLKIEDNATNPVYITTVWGYGYKWGF